MGVGLHDKGDEVIMHDWQEITNTGIYKRGNKILRNHQ